MRADLTQKVLSNDRICSRHFISGKPATLLDENNPDWLPTLNLGNSKQISDTKARAAEQRWERAKLRESMKVQAPEIVSSRGSCLPEGPSSSGVDVSSTSSSDGGSLSCSGGDGTGNGSGNSNIVNLGLVDTSTQTKITSSLIDDVNDGLMYYKQKACTLKEELRLLKSDMQPFTEKTFTDDDEYVKFYTGLPNFKVLKSVFDFVALPPTSTTKLTRFQEFILTLIKLRLDSPYKDLAYRFGISISTVSRIISKWLTMMDDELRDLIIWPTRDSQWKTMPLCFRSSFGKDVAVILDCFEVFMERPSNLLARACTWSSYKHHNTVKILLGITPQGTVSYVSEAWGGRVSDKYLTESCGILNHLLPGDIVLADRGFDISESVGMMQARLHIPATC